MSHSVSFDKKENIITITLKGKINLLTVIDAASEVARIVKEHQCFLVLNDAREATFDLSVLQIYDLPKVFSEILIENGIQIDKLKRAIVVSKGEYKLNFYETVSLNRGQEVMLFDDLQEATNWLFQKQQPMT